MGTITFRYSEAVPLESHRVRIVQKLELLPVEQRLAKLKEAKNNLYLLHNRDIFLDMLTDSGVNAMSDNQLAATINADDAYAGSETFYILEKKVQSLFGMEHFLPAHQGRACEKLLTDMLVKPGDLVPMNYHFTTTKAHITRCGGEVLELIKPAGLNPVSHDPFKGDIDLDALKDVLDRERQRIPFVRIEAGTNLIGGQPVSLDNMRQTAKLCKAAGVPLMMDASLLQDNLHFLKTRDEHCKNLSIKEITKEVSSLFDIIYFSARKLGFATGGGIALRDAKHLNRLKELVVRDEGFLTYGGMSTKEMAAIAIGLDETMEESVISHGPQFIEFFVNELDRLGIPVVTPPGGLGCHLDASRFVPHIPQSAYPAASLSAALYIAGGIRGMERGTLSEDRNPDGSEHFASMELLRLALPRRVFTLSQIKYAIDRIHWLWDNRQLIEGLTFTTEPEILRFFVGELAPLSDWQETLAKAFRRDFADSL